MKTRIMVAFVFLRISISWAQPNQTIELPGRIDEITLFLNGAEIKFHQTLPIKKGESRIVIKDISPYLQNGSVQLTANDNIEISSISTVEAKYDAQQIDKGAAKLHHKMHQTEILIKAIQAQADAHESEKVMLKANQQVGGGQTMVSLVELGKAADFFHERILKINNTVLQLNSEADRLNLVLDSLKSALAKHTTGLVTARKEIRVVLNSNIDQDAILQIRYVVDHANWESAYDIIATDITQPVKLKYKAKIFNQTGIDWHQVKVTLSTADPSLNASRPLLTAWTLNYQSQGNEGFLQNRFSNNAFLGDSISSGGQEVTVSELSTAFKIQNRYSIATGEEPYLIEVIQESLNATYQYLAIPKMDASAFLIAKVTGWEKLNLIDGPAQVYFGNTYIGQSDIRTRQISDTLELSFGRDNQILVSRAKLEDTGGTKFIGTKRTESFLYEIVIKNNRKSPISIKVQDQIPIAQETDITVESRELSGASLDNLSGRLQWLKFIAPDQSAKFRIGFEVKYPKNKNLVVRKDRMIRTPRYKHR